MDFPSESVDEMRNPTVALVAERRYAARSGQESPFHSSGRIGRPLGNIRLCCKEAA